MRIAAIAATESGVIVNAPVHDAFLIEAKEQDIEQEVFRMRMIMQHAGETILGGFPLRVDSQIVRYPDRYQDERGTTFWNTVWQLILEQDRLAPIGAPCLN
jgi:hypothetical protein